MAKIATAKRETGKRNKSTELRLDIKPVYQGGEPICGVCACAAVYNLFKISVQGLRERLSPDRIVIPQFQLPLRDEVSEWLEGATGQWAASVCEVIWEDGFDYETTSDYEVFIGMMPMLLDMGYPSLVVVNKINHWVVVSGIDGDRIWIVDSNCKKPFPTSIEEFKKTFKCAIMITGHGARRKPGRKDYIRNYISGAKIVAIAAKKALIY